MSTMRLQETTHARRELPRGANSRHDSSVPSPEVRDPPTSPGTASTAAAKWKTVPTQQKGSKI